jgi:hypothetical protein
MKKQRPKTGSQLDLELADESSTVSIDDVVSRIRRLDEYLKKIERRIETREKQLQQILDLSDKEKILLKKGLSLYDVEESGISI